MSSVMWRDELGSSVHAPELVEVVLTDQHGGNLLEATVLPVASHVAYI
jgi:hypothetical protein